MGSPGSPRPLVETLRVHPELKDVDDGPDGGQLNMPADGTATTPPSSRAYVAARTV